MKTNRQARRETYTGNRAKSYENTRQGQFWNLEQGRMDRLSARMEPGTKLLDVPVGTGRFLKIWEAAELEVTGVDLSADMLREAAKKRTYATLAQGSIFDLAHPDDAFDVAVCVRLLNWLETHEVGAALSELGRVASQYVIAGAGTYTKLPKLRSVQCIHPEAAFLEQVEAAGLEVVARHHVQNNDRGLFEFWELR